MNIRKSDKILVIKGKDRGKTGNIDRVLPKIAAVVVAGLNVYKKHLRRSQKNPHGGIIDISLPIAIANVQLLCPRCQKPTIVAWQTIEKNKIRICKKCREMIDSSK